MFFREVVYNLSLGGNSVQTATFRTGSLLHSVNLFLMVLAFLHKGEEGDIGGGINA